MLWYKGRYVVVQREVCCGTKGGMLWYKGRYVVATISRLLKIIALFCRISSLF